jgi:hypothetical protein
VLVSVAVGSQLADVFLHLLPSAFGDPNASSTYIGLWTLIGLFTFFLIEQIFGDSNGQIEENELRIVTFFVLFFSNKSEYFV